jgi:hypothetical protein
MMISSRSSAAECGSLRIPKSLMIGSGTVATESCTPCAFVGDNVGQFIEQDETGDHDSGAKPISGMFSKGV